MTYFNTTLRDTLQNETFAGIEGDGTYLAIEAETQHDYVSVSFSAGDQFDRVKAAVDAIGPDHFEARVEDSYGDGTLTLVGTETSLNLKVNDGDEIVVRLNGDSVKKLKAVVNGEDPEPFTPTPPVQADRGFVVERTEDPGPTPEETFESADPDPRTAWNLSAIETAASYGITVQFRYAKSESAPIETRTLRDLAVVTTEEGEKLATGIDPDRDGVRAFRLDRIKGFVSAA
jgi:hypothetical protein